ncbi:MAG: glycerol-3-phosphate acyltransferase [Dictyoglomus sp.]
MEFLRFVLRGLTSVFLGYIFGSFLPGYFLPLWIKGVDIRRLGDGNPGVLNVKKTLGNFLAFWTAFYDVLKGFIPMGIVYFLLNFPLGFAYLSGFSAVLGHKYPFYLAFKGGRGFATSISLFLFIFTKVLIQNFNLFQILALFLYIGIYGFLLNIATHNKGDVFTMSMFPIIGVFISLNINNIVDIAFILALVFVITYEAVKNLIRDGFKFYIEKHIFWRIIMRPFALLFIPLYLILSKMIVLFIIGFVLLLFFVLDLLRILISKVESFLQLEIIKNIRIFKEKERGRVSSITNFLLGIFISFALFEKNVVFASLGFVSLGDMMSKWVGINFGSRKIFKNSEKTLEGSLAFLSTSLTVAFFLWFKGLMPFHIVFLGALVASIIEAVPNPIDDNFSVPVISGAVMEVLKKILY